jgi:hypothetical protein
MLIFITLLHGSPSTGKLQQYFASALAEDYPGFSALA